MDGSTYRIEWPTIGLIAIVYLVLGLLIWFNAVLPWWIILPIGAYAAALHCSLQHEVLHGHPTSSRLVNEALVILSPCLWLPFHLYRDSHLKHHNDEHLTCPVRDPESYYMLPDNWVAMPGLKRSIYIANQTLAGRMVIGPAISIIRVWHGGWMEIIAGNRQAAKSWMSFCMAGAAMIALVIAAGMPIWQFVLLIAYPGISLSLVRSFCEHQAAEDLDDRTIIVEASAFWALLFLNNNLHIAHHTRPGLPWYQIPAYYRKNRETMIARNHGYLMQGYGEIFRRYAFSPKEPVPYPNLSWLRR